MGLGWVEEDTSSHVLPYTCLALCILLFPAQPSTRQTPFLLGRGLVWAVVPAGPWPDQRTSLPWPHFWEPAL